MFKLSAITLLLASQAAALDFSLSSISCDEDYPVTMDGGFICDGSNPCTFGSYVEFEGALTYNGLDETDVVNNGNIAYASVDLTSDAGGLTYDSWIDSQAILLCGYDGQTASANNEYDCPGDGTYYYDSLFTVPTFSDSDFASWLASGWTGTATVVLRDAASNGNNIGKCQISFETHASHSNPLLKVFTGKVGIFIMFGILALIGLACCHCAICGCGNPNRKGDRDSSGGFFRMADKV